MKESQVVTTTVKIHFGRKIQSLKEFNQIGNKINQSIKQSKLYISDSKFTIFFMYIDILDIIDILTYLVISVGATNSCSTDLEIATLCFSL